MDTLEMKIAKLTLKKGDILLVEKSFNSQTQLTELLKAGKYVKEDVPIIFVDNIEGYMVLEIDESLRSSEEFPDSADAGFDGTNSTMRKLAESLPVEVQELAAKEGKAVSNVPVKVSQPDSSTGAVSSQGRYRIPFSSSRRVIS